MRLVQPAPSKSAPLVALWLVGPQMDAALRAALPGCAIVADVERALRPDLAAVRRLAGTTGPLVVGGWSAGVQGPRQVLVDGADVAGVIAIDGTAANLPPAAWQIDVWREFAAEARAGRKLFVATASQQVYTEALRDDPRTPAVEAPFMATVHVLERAVGGPLPPGAEVHEGGLHVYSVPSARIDAEAHREQLRVWLPRVLREHVEPWLASRATTAPATSATASATPPDPAPLEPAIRPNPAGSTTTATTTASRATTADCPRILARNFTKGRLAPVRVVVLHTTEGDLRPGAARAVASWFAGPSAPRASAHYVVDVDEVIACVAEADTAWAAPGANAQGIQIEMVGWARWTRERWDATDARAMLERAAQLVAGVCSRHSIPAEYVGAEGLLSGARGITTHAQVSRAFKRSSHWDPGAGWPLAWFIERVSNLSEG